MRRPDSLASPPAATLATRCTVPAPISAVTRGWASRSWYQSGFDGAPAWPACGYVGAKSSPSFAPAGSSAGIAAAPYPVHEGLRRDETAREGDIELSGICLAPELKRACCASP
jgi:hypothetical protein